MGHSRKVGLLDNGTSAHRRDSHSDHLRTRAHDAVLHKLTHYDGLALALIDNLGAQLHVLINGRGLEEVNGQLSGDEHEGWWSVLQRMADVAASGSQCRPYRMAIDHRGDCAAVDVTRVSDVIRLGPPSAHQIFAVPMAFDLQPMGIERAASKAIHFQNVLQCTASVGVDDRGLDEPRLAYDTATCEFSSP